MPNRIYILSGAPGAGKTLLLNEILKKKKETSIASPKYSTRKKRTPDDDIITKEL